MIIRESLRDIAFMVKDVPYPGDIPAEVAHLHYYISDSGHCIMSIPKVFEDKAKENGAAMYEVALPVKYVLEKGYRLLPGTDSIVVEVEYDEDFGTMIPEGYSEF